MGEVRVLVAEDHPFMSQALRQFVDSAPGLTCVGEVRNGELAVRHCALLVPDVVLMDMQMPVLDGVEATRIIAQTHPSIKILALSTFSSAEYLVPVLKAGASGYLLKDAEPDEIVQAVFAVHSGEAVLSPSVSKELIASIRGDGIPAKSPVEGINTLISAREYDVLGALARGKSNSEIAADLYVSEAVVKAHLTRIMAKLQVRDRVQTVIRAAQLGLVELSLD